MSTDPTAPGPPPAPDPGDTRRSAVGKALDLLAAYEGGGRASLSLTELASHADVPLSTAHRLVADLVAAGFLRRDPDARLRVGRRVWRIAQNAGRELQDTARPHLAALFRRTGFTSQLAIRDGGHALVIDRVHGPGAAPSAARPGERLPLHACAVGKVLLAFDEPWLQAGYLTRTLEAATPATEVDASSLAALLADVRRDGHATSLEESKPGTCAVAMPVLLGGAVVAGVGLVAPAGQARRLREHLPALDDTARAVALDAPRWPHLRAVTDPVLRADPA